jgi:hypothetical protein
VHLDHRRHAAATDLGLPEMVGFALGAGAMATAMAALEASLSGSERARRLVREGVLAELHRVAADLVPAPRAGHGGRVVAVRDGNLEECRVRQGES